LGHANKALYHSLLGSRCQVTMIVQGTYLFTNTVTKPLNALHVRAVRYLPLWCWDPFGEFWYPAVDIMMGETLELGRCFSWSGDCRANTMACMDPYQILKYETLLPWHFLNFQKFPLSFSYSTHILWDYTRLPDAKIWEGAASSCFLPLFSWIPISKIKWICGCLNQISWNVNLLLADSSLNTYSRDSELRSQIPDYPS
jgi:hypothetical protein